MKIVNDHNLAADLGVHTYWLGMNAYADMVKKSHLLMDKLLIVLYSSMNRPMLNSTVL